MTILERLDRAVIYAEGKRSSPFCYDFDKDDLRRLLEDAANKIRELEKLQMIPREKYFPFPHYRR